MLSSAITSIKMFLKLRIHTAVGHCGFQDSFTIATDTINEGPLFGEFGYQDLLLVFVRNLIVVRSSYSLVQMSSAGYGYCDDEVGSTMLSCLTFTMLDALAWQVTRFLIKLLNVCSWGRLHWAYSLSLGLPLLQVFLSLVRSYSEFRRYLSTSYSREDGKAGQWAERTFSRRKLSHYRRTTLNLHQKSIHRLKRIHMEDLICSAI